MSYWWAASGIVSACLPVCSCPPVSVSVCWLVCQSVSLSFCLSGSCGCYWVIGQSVLALHLSVYSSLHACHSVLGWVVDANGSYSCFVASLFFAWCCINSLVAQQATTGRIRQMLEYQQCRYKSFLPFVKLNQQLLLFQPVNCWPNLSGKLVNQLMGFHIFRTWILVVWSQGEHLVMFCISLLVVCHNLFLL